MRTLKGTPSNIQTPVLGKVKHNPTMLPWSRNSIIVSKKPPATWLGYAGFLSSEGMTYKTSRLPSVTGIPEDAVTSLEDGDVVRLMPDGTVHVLWEAKSPDNVLFATDYCDSKCVMCPQATDDVPRHHYETCQSILSLARNTCAEHIGITGGEPTLDPNGLAALLGTCSKLFPDAAVSLLTNGKRLSDFDIAWSLSRAHRHMVMCIPLYADNDVEHDGIVGFRGSFKETMLGLYNLARLKQPVEIRVVVMRRNYRRLPDLAEFIYYNLPFARHVALMGMECVGKATENLESVWVDPTDYQGQLEQAVRILHQRAMNVSVYNLPHCLLPRTLWRFSRDSVSGWKKTFHPECALCAVKSSCAGLFGTSIRQSPNISPLTSNSATD